MYPIVNLKRNEGNIMKMYYLEEVKNSDLFMIKIGNFQKVGKKPTDFDEIGNNSDLRLLLVRHSAVFKTRRQALKEIKLRLKCKINFYEFKIYKLKQYLATA